MRRNWIIAGLLVSVGAGALAYQRSANWKEFRFVGTHLKVNLAKPDALIRTASLARLPHDLLKVPMARDVLTEDLAFYYDQHEDRLGLNGAIKRIAYEHNLDWTDHLFASAMNEPAEVALWRDGKGALRHYAIVMQRNALAKVMQQAASVALKDGQLAHAGLLETPNGKATMLNLVLNPRASLLLISKGDRLVVLSEPGLLLGKGNKVVPAARDAVLKWLSDDTQLAKQFALEAGPAAPVHSMAVGAPTLALGYGAFLSGFKGLRFDYREGWSTSVWVDQAAPKALGDAALWRAAPANPAACMLAPVNWRMVEQVVQKADEKPALPDAKALAALDGAGMVCWYKESSLYSPVFITRLKTMPRRQESLQALAAWAIDWEAPKTKPSAPKSGVMSWTGADGKSALGARGDYVAFSPDGALVSKVLDTIARTHPSVADQMPTSDATLGLLGSKSLSAMAEREVLAALSGNDKEVAQQHLPPKMKALSAYPAYRMEVASGPASGWQPVEWRALDAAK